VVLRHWTQEALIDVLKWPRATVTLAVAAKLSLTSLKQYTLRVLVTLKTIAVSQKLIYENRQASPSAWERWIGVSV